MRIVTVIGARPQFVKAAVVSRVLATCGDWCSESIVHTGQHFDPGMSSIFFEELEIPRPDHHLDLGGGSHGRMTGRMIERIEQILIDERPDRVIVYGDTNSTLAGTLAAVKLGIPVAHVEAGLRSFNRAMPEEINRVLTDHASSLLFAPTVAAKENLRREGIAEDLIELVGDVMLDAMNYYRAKSARQSTITATMGLTSGRYVLATIHRAENTDDPRRLEGVLKGLAGLAEELPVVLPLHPRARRRLNELGMFDDATRRLEVIEPVGYLDMVSLESSAALIVTDSGGVQKEAYFNRVPCLTTRDETEWIELVDAGANTIVGTDPERIVSAGISALGTEVKPTDLYGAGDAGERIVRSLELPA